MGNFKAGFARVDITAPIGAALVGYYRLRTSIGILDPLLATAVAVSDGENTAVILSLDIIGIDQDTVNRIRLGVEEKHGVPHESVFVACTHTHLGYGVAKGDVREDNPEDLAHVDMIINKAIGVAKMAIDDMKDAEMYVGATETPVDISFVRRFRMKDGSVATNPGWLNPEIDHALGEPDKRVALTYFKREGAPEIAIINFQVHPDVISGCLMSADYPHFVRDTYETVIPNSLCMYINGAQGDTNHINVKTPEDRLRRGYDMARHMGRTIAGTAIALYATAEKAEACPVAGKEINIEVPFNKAETAEELEQARYIKKLYDEGRGNEIPIPKGHGSMSQVTAIAGACRAVSLENEPEFKTLRVTGIRVGDFALVGFPGEPFTEIGRQVKAASDYKMTYIACCANGYEGYYPSATAMEEGGYEAATARYKKGTAEKLIETGIEVLEKLKK
ncbi:MAG: hypothetical protein IJW69_03275 [Clostridia bacterium]|nr:hypothetical protein [Clostridia bacterium]